MEFKRIIMKEEDIPIMTLESVIELIRKNIFSSKFKYEIYKDSGGIIQIIFKMGDHHVTPNEKQKMIKILHELVPAFIKVEHTLNRDMWYESQKELIIIYLDASKLNEKKLNEVRIDDQQQPIEKSIEMIEDALDLVDKARFMVREALKLSRSTKSLLPHYEAYGEYGFKQLMGQGNPYDGSLPKLIEELQNLEEDEEDEGPDNVFVNPKPRGGRLQ